MTDFWDETLTPAPPIGRTEGVGVSPYPFNDVADVTPQAPTGDGDHVGVSPYPCGAADVHPTVDRHDGNMDLHLGQTKPGSFGSDHDAGDMS